MSVNVTEPHVFQRVPTPVHQLLPAFKYPDGASLAYVDTRPSDIGEKVCLERFSRLYPVDAYSGTHHREQSLLDLVRKDSFSLDHLLGSLDSLVTLVLFTKFHTHLTRQGSVLAGMQHISGITSQQPSCSVHT